MSRAFKCDRCKKLFEPYDSKNDLDLWDRNGPGAAKCLDLCPECNKNLSVWLHAFDLPKEWSGELHDFAERHCDCDFSVVESTDRGLVYKCYHENNRSVYCDRNLCPMFTEIADVKWKEAKNNE